MNPSEQFSDSEWETIHRLKAGGESVRLDFFLSQAMHLRRLLRFKVHPCVRRRLDMSDVLQDIYMQFLSQLPGYLKQPTVPPNVWLRGVAWRALWRIHRDQLDAQCRDPRREVEWSSVQVDLLSASLSTVSERMQSREQNQRIRRTVMQLPENDKTILQLVHYEGMTIRHAAAALEVEYETAKKRYQRAIHRLKQAVDKGRLTGTGC